MRCPASRWRLCLRAVGPLAGTSATLLGLLVALGVGLACGVLNGALVVGLRVHPFIITLGTMWVLRGIAFVATKAESILVPASLTTVTKASFGLGGGLYPVPMLAMIVLTILGVIYLTRTTMGRRIFAFGGNLEASRFAGLSLSRIQIGVFAVSGLTAGLAAFLGGSFYGSVSSGDAQGYELYVIASAVVGGASLLGGKGSALGAMLGALLDRADPAIDPHAALRPELRVDRDWLRDHHRGGGGPVERASHGPSVEPGGGDDACGCVKTLHVIPSRQARNPCSLYRGPLGRDAKDPSLCSG